jgi:hypothetical protein
MNEVEKLLAGLPLPSPSPSLELDARIAQLARAQAEAATVPTRRRWLGALAASTACAACLGFILGRQSVQPSGAAAGIHSDDRASLRAAPAVESATERAIVNVTVPPTEALTRFVMLPQRSESLFGRGPFQEQVDHSPLE